MNIKTAILPSLILVTFLFNSSHSLATDSEVSTNGQDIHQLYGKVPTNHQDFHQLFDAQSEDPSLVARTASGIWQQMLDSTEISKRDAERRKRLKELLNNGQPPSADDYYYAAEVMAHGDGPDDYLLCHVLAVASLKLGREKSAWLAGVSLDRYLLKIGQPQIFGSQFNNQKPAAKAEIAGDPFAPAEIAVEPFNESLIPDPLRETFAQPPIAELSQRVHLLKQNKP